MVNDLYKRFIVRDKSPKHYVLMGRLCMILSACIAGFVAVISKNILTLSMLTFEIAAGVGMIFILRWLWWRINAWSELSSYLVGIIGAILVNISSGQQLLMKITLMFTPENKTGIVENFFTNEINGMSGFPFRMTFLAVFSTTICLIITLLTKPCEQEHLVAFYKKIKPPRIGWKKISEVAGPVELEAGQIPFQWSTLAIGAVMFYSTFFALGRLPFGYYKSGILSLAIAVVSGVSLWKKLRQVD